MIDKLLQHIRALSNSQLGHFNALETFARCFHAIYGETSFISLDHCGESQKCRVRLIYRGGQAAGQQLETHLHHTRLFSCPQAEQIIGDRRPVIIDAISPELQKLLRSYRLPGVSMMAIPLFLDGEIRRWVFVLGDQPQQFRDVELEQAMLLANLANSYMARIDETRALAVANAWIERELNDIGRLQQLLLPQQDIRLRGTEIATHFSACSSAGGDYYDVVNLSEFLEPHELDAEQDSWGNIIADASGHGAAAAVEIAMFDALLRTYRGSASAGPANVFNYTNKYFFTRMLRGSYITASILNYDARTRTLLYANAGHPPAILRQPNGELVCLDQHDGIPLGVDPKWEWQNTCIDIQAGTLLVNYTDGIIEALSPEGEQFGQTRLMQLIAESQGDAHAIKQAIVEAVIRHQGGAEQHDDQALVVIDIHQAKGNS